MKMLIFNQRNSINSINRPQTKVSRIANVGRKSSNTNKKKKEESSITEENKAFLKALGYKLGK